MGFYYTTHLFYGIETTEDINDDDIYKTLKHHNKMYKCYKISHLEDDTSCISYMTFRGMIVRFNMTPELYDLNESGFQWMYFANGFDTYGSSTSTSSINNQSTDAKILIMSNRDEFLTMYKNKILFHKLRQFLGKYESTSLEGIDTYMHDLDKIKKILEDLGVNNTIDALEKTSCRYDIDSKLMFSKLSDMSAKYKGLSLEKINILKNEFEDMKRIIQDFEEVDAQKAIDKASILVFGPDV